ncbi:MAG: amidohydrolase family protein, partial [Deltaproteobacteria bacterium]
MKKSLIIVAFLAALIMGMPAISSVVSAAGAPPAAKAKAEKTKQDQILFKNDKIFNGVDNKLITGNVLVEGNLIKSIGKNVNARPDATVIDGGGRTLMPGMIDGHAHVMINA